ncbi:aldolase catalytic domain-containing protein [Fulvivirga ulvae]|uniref:aldolase catalytic domain-containing protein n=1 Tax=Fulvivirga ulvae TaxID=2904245 RepID=UPI001F3E78EB|nr:aldolase catalytic domain-containing protein [Fulvivirga ulvae]UII31660.1 aldolase catalytic domain-containing protein [Fulvivirga ulvae]
MNFKILDCTLRDGGYYTQWDFEENLIENYINSFNYLPVDYLEIGYRSKPMKDYHGEYFYCPTYILERVRRDSGKKLAIILNEKDVRAHDVENLLIPCNGHIDLVRIAVDPSNFERALGVAEEVKKLGFEVSFNVMYMSKWKENKEFLNHLSGSNGLLDFFYLVDSYGGVYPADVKETIEMVKERVNCKIGFHGHNNLELALINTLTAIDCGADIVDATITGMGRGAGNLKTELLLTALNTKTDLALNFDALSNVVTAFENLREEHNWGTNLPYMVSGANSLPQKNVMEWVTQRFYSFNSIIRALQNQRQGVQDNQHFPTFKPERKFKQALIIGGGPNAIKHSTAIKEYVRKGEDICIIHASSKNAKAYRDLNVEQFFCLVGSEGHRLEKVFDDFGDFTWVCVLPPFPRKMGTYIPKAVNEETYELEQIDFSDKLTDTHTALALQTSVELASERVLIAGYDGYQESTLTQLERNLSEENEYLFKVFSEAHQLEIACITPTNYKSLPVTSVYSFLL